MNKACGIICEYNPFHNGHKYQIDHIKSETGLPVVCAMSGAFVQRGEPACKDKNLRASDAVRNGAEVVFEIPFPYSSMTAEKFAEAGVGVLIGSGVCSHIAFGSECGDVSLLSEIAKTLLEEGFTEALKKSRDDNPNMSYALLREREIERRLGKEAADALRHPNDILAVEYIKAIIKSGKDVTPIAVKRTVGRNGKSGGFASSSLIREMISEGMDDKARQYVPEDCGFSDIRTDFAPFYKVLHASLMTRTPEELSNIPEIGGGLEHAVVKAARTSGSYQEMFQKLRSKTITDAKLRRALLFAFFGVGKETYGEKPRYANVLAMSDTEEAARLMRTSRKEKSIVVSHRISEIKKDESAYRQYDFCRNCENVLSVASKRS